MTLDDDMRQSADTRLDGLRRLAELRMRSRRATRERLARRRAAGLRVRHKSKLDRMEGTGQ